MVKVKGPPPEIRTGCDLVIEFPLIEELNVLRVLEGSGVKPLKVVPVQSALLEPVSLFHTKDFGEYLMIRAANMKLTVDKKTMTIVNISGGGCPDVPFLAQEMVGKTLSEAPTPRAIGHTLVRLCPATGLRRDEAPMLAVVGTVPDEDFPLLEGEVRLENDMLLLQGRRIPVNRGTPALLAAAIAAGQILGNAPPYTYLVGDIGTGKGKSKALRAFSQALAEESFRSDDLSLPAA